MRKGVFIPDITVDMFKNATLESVEEFMTSGQMEDIEIPERLHGEWIRQKATYGYTHTCECSICGRVIYAPTKEDLLDFPFCHCGADMRKEGDPE